MEETARVLVTIIEENQEKLWNNAQEVSCSNLERLFTQTVPGERKLHDTDGRRRDMRDSKYIGGYGKLAQLQFRIFERELSVVFCTKMRKQGTDAQSRLTTSLTDVTPVEDRIRELTTTAVEILKGNDYKPPKCYMPCLQKL